MKSVHLPVLTKGQTDLFSDKFMDTANYILVGFVVTEFVQEKRRLFLVFSGMVIYTLVMVYCLKLKGENERK